MKLKIMISIGIVWIISIFYSYSTSKQIDSSDRIIGKWASTNHDLIVEVYRTRNEFKSKIIWFDDRDDLSKPLNLRTDFKNPDPSLRNRKQVGLDIMKKMVYNRATDTWEKGIIYDPSSGREWSSYAYFTPEGLLHVKGYWHFKFIGQTMEFVRTASNKL